jgi:enamine deaminase RidA (YjgF/YER057c/UK114 family)
MRKLTTALALIIATTASSAFAFDPTDMHMGRTMLEAQIANAFKTFGISHDATTLTLNQIAKIEGILAQSDESDADMKQSIEQALREE